MIFPGRQVIAGHKVFRAQSQGRGVEKQHARLFAHENDEQKKSRNDGIFNSPETAGDSC